MAKKIIVAVEPISDEWKADAVFFFGTPKGGADMTLIAKLGQQRNGRRFHLLRVSPVQNEFSVITEEFKGVLRKLHDDPP